MEIGEPFRSVTWEGAVTQGKGVNQPKRSRHVRTESQNIEPVSAPREPSLHQINPDIEILRVETEHSYWQLGVEQGAVFDSRD